MLGGDAHRNESNLLNLSTDNEIRPQMMLMSEISSNDEISENNNEKSDFKITGMDDIRFN